MRSFSEYDPLAVTAIIFSITGVVMFCSYPAFTAVALISGALYYTVLCGRERLKRHVWFGALFAVLALANPLISHNGVTVLFVINNNPVTLEAFLYGINSAAMVVGALYWFSIFSKIMTSEKLLYITGVLSPKLSLVMSMAIRFVPMFRAQAKKVSDAQKAMGLFREDNFIDDIRGYMRIFSILTTWALENGITTADSMTARGYGVGRRTHFSSFRMRKNDILLLAAGALLLGLCAAAALSLSFSFYPRLEADTPDASGIAGIAAYAVLCMLPVIIETEATLKWKYLQSKV